MKAKESVPVVVETKEDPVDMDKEIEVEETEEEGEEEKEV